MSKKKTGMKKMNRQTKEKAIRAEKKIGVQVVMAGAKEIIGLVMKSTRKVVNKVIRMMQ